jgi:hypothetical protein
MASKPVLRTKREIVLPAKAGSIVVSFRARKHKGAIKNTRKVSVPRGAEQVNVRIRKTRALAAKKAAAVKKNVKPAVKKAAVKKVKPAVKKKSGGTSGSRFAAKKKVEAAQVRTFTDNLPAKVLAAMFRCVSPPHRVDRIALKSVFFDKENGHIVASNERVLVCLPAKVSRMKLLNKDGREENDRKYPNYLQVIPRPEDALIKEDYDYSTWVGAIKKALASAKKYQKVLMQYDNSQVKILLDPKELLLVLGFLKATGVSRFTVESKEETSAVVFRHKGMYLGVAMPIFPPFSVENDEHYFIAPLV